MRDWFIVCFAVPPLFYWYDTGENPLAGGLGVLWFLAFSLVMFAAGAVLGRLWRWSRDFDKRD